MATNRNTINVAIDCPTLMKAIHLIAADNGGRVVTPTVWDNLDVNTFVLIKYAEQALAKINDDDFESVVYGESQHSASILRALRSEFMPVFDPAHVVSEILDRIFDADLSSVIDYGGGAVTSRPLNRF
jgi:hypothetical protein